MGRLVEGSKGKLQTCTDKLTSGRMWGKPLSLSLGVSVAPFVNEEVGLDHPLRILPALIALKWE